LVDEKLKEMEQPGISAHQTVFGLTRERLRKLRAQVRSDLKAVLREDAPPFDLESVIHRFARLWALAPPAE